MVVKRSPAITICIRELQRGRRAIGAALVLAICLSPERSSADLLPISYIHSSSTDLLRHRSHRSCSYGSMPRNQI
ncbi:hypothetical protein TIFTF001_029837 [Ficus carica]|uniref:Uncharacterized protein n=1 Tax=Ficus carica TaxID=3494 RepID=A0AA88DSP0_FICCA|nr:hypothetical protein TIFTF001_029837 [Ficus carica]